MPRPHAPVEFSEHRSVMFVCPHSVNGQLTSDIQLYLSERNGENKLGRNPLEPQKTIHDVTQGIKSRSCLYGKSGHESLVDLLTETNSFTANFKNTLYLKMRINRKNIYAEV